MSQGRRNTDGGGGDEGWKRESQRFWWSRKPLYCNGPHQGTSHLQAPWRLLFCLVMRSRKGQAGPLLAWWLHIKSEHTWHRVLGELGIPQTSPCPPTWGTKVLWLPSSLFSPPSGWLCRGQPYRRESKKSLSLHCPGCPQPQSNSHLPWLALLHCPEGAAGQRPHCKPW